MNYTLTAEQMQQVREAVENADNVCRVSGWPENRKHMRAALALLDAAMQAPEATAGGDVREALANLDRYTPSTNSLNGEPCLCRIPTGEAVLYADVWKALAAAPKPCEPEACECGGTGYLEVTPKGTICPRCSKPRSIHGTKPEAPTELCKVCGGSGLCPGGDIGRKHDCPACEGTGEATDATPKDEEPGR